MSNESNYEIRINNLPGEGQLNDDMDFIPLTTDEDDEAVKNIVYPEVIPILPLKNTVLFPGVLIPITVGRKKSMKLIQDAYNGNRIIGTLTQKDSKIEEPEFKDLYSVGTIAQILKILEMPDGATSVIIQGRSRFKAEGLVSSKPYFNSRIEILKDVKPEKGDREFEALVASLKDLSIKIIQLSTNIPPEASFAVKNIDSYNFLINFISSNSNINAEEKQKLLEIDHLKPRAFKLMEHLTKEVQMLELKSDIQAKVKFDLDQQQREFMLHQQMKTIQDELGDNPVDQEIEELKKKGKKKKWGNRLP